MIRLCAALFPSLQGHVYSLGSTLSAALNFVIEPELEAELGEEVQRLLEQMQEEKPEDRPHLQVQTPHMGRCADSHYGCSSNVYLFFSTF